MSKTLEHHEARTGRVFAVDGPRVGDAPRAGKIFEVADEPDREYVRVQWTDGRESVLYPDGCSMRLQHCGRLTREERS